MPRVRGYYLVPLFLLVFLWAGGGKAQSVAPDGAARLAAIFNTFIEQQKEILVPALGASLIYDGQVTVERAGTYYAVTLPHIRALYPDGRVFELGMVSINAVPDRIPGRWMMTVALPVPMLMFDGDKRKIMRVSAGTQKAIGVWDERLGGFISFNGIYKDVTIDGVTRDYTMTIPSLSTRYDFSDNSMSVEMGGAIFKIVLGRLLAGAGR